MTSLLEFDTYSIVNLVRIPSKDLPELNLLGCDSRAWSQSRPAIANALRESDSLFAAWGLGGFGKATRLNFDKQIAWLITQATRYEHDVAWTVDGRPRHPSRWRQYVGPMRARYSGETLEARLTASLRQIPLTTLSG
jgi:hypothetical protein